jgi:hypothetical protein
MNAAQVALLAGVGRTLSAAQSTVQAGQQQRQQQQQQTLLILARSTRHCRQQQTQSHSQQPRHLQLLLRSGKQLLYMNAAQGALLAADGRMLSAAQGTVQTGQQQRQQTLR